MEWIKEMLEDYMKRGLSLEEAIDRLEIDFGVDMSEIKDELYSYAREGNINKVAELIHNYLIQKMVETEQNIKLLATKLAEVYRKYKFKKPPYELLEHIKKDLEEKKKELEKYSKRVQLSKEELKHLIQLVRSIRDLERRAEIMRKLFKS